MDVITMGSCSFPLNGVMVVLVFARFFCEFIIYYIDDSAEYLRDTMPSNNEYHEGYLSLEDQDEMNRNESMGEGNGEVRRTSSALDGFDASASLPRNHIDSRTRETSTNTGTGSSFSFSFSTSASNGIVINRAVPSTVIMEEDMSCNLSSYAMLDMPLYLPSVTHRVTPPSFFSGTYQPASSRMTRDRLIKILNEALSIMDNGDDDDDDDGDDYCLADDDNLEFSWNDEKHHQNQNDGRDREAPYPPS